MIYDIYILIYEISHAYVESIINYRIDIDSWSKYSPVASLFLHST